jgi:hypothetical protein
MSPLDLLTRDAADTLEIRDALVRPRSFDAAALTIEAVIATATPVTRRDARGEYLEILDVAGADLAALRGASVLDGHRQGSVASIIGRVDDAWIEGDQLIARLRLSSRAELAPIVGDIRDGIIAGLSAGYDVQEWRDGEANGRRTRTAARWRPREVSFVGVAADPNARTRDLPAHGRAAINRQIRELGRRAGVPVDITDGLIDDGASLDQARNALFDDLLTRGGVRIRAAVGESYDGPDATARAMGEALYCRMAGTAPSERARPFMHRSMIDMARDSLRAGGLAIGNDPAEIYRAAFVTRASPGGLHSTSDFPTVLGDNMGRRLGELFRAAQSGASAIVATGTARDFRRITEARLTSFPSLELLGQGGEITSGTLDEEGETLMVASYARRIGVTFQVLVNDDLAGIDRSIRDIAFATAQLKAKLIVAALGSGLADGKALFHVDHKNLTTAAGAPPDETTLSEGRTAMQKQSPPNSTEPLGLSPAILLVPAELQTTSEKLVATITPPTVEDVNVFAGRLQVAVEPRLATPTEWYLFAAPGTYPVIRFLTLAGFESPRFETEQEFTRLGTSYRVHWHVGAGPIDFRGAWKNPGGAP